MVRVHKEKGKTLMRKQIGDQSTKQSDTLGAPHLGLGHGRLVNDQPPLAKRKGDGKPTPQGRGPPAGSPVRPVLRYTRLFAKFEGPNDLQIRRKKTITTVSKRASQRRKNYVDTILVLQEKSRKP